MKNILQKMANATVDSGLKEKTMGKKSQTPAINNITRSFIACGLVASSIAVGGYMGVKSAEQTVKVANESADVSDVMRSAQNKADKAPQNAGIRWEAVSMLGQKVSGTIRLIQAKREDGVHETRHFVMEIRAAGKPLFSTNYQRTQNNSGEFEAGPNEPTANSIFQISSR